ncbi:hypothetical protein M9H77_18620 [Catharanthus roseus]|uniref:Uncharacterized protein n=1 Tax=Catharanthus roseus TaxID=4058 RepID=A0ACC0B839_CATRO|nr:hypothetical protein M9H77_18620 [Catharanthus roseus]
MLYSIEIPCLGLKLSIFVILQTTSACAILGISIAMLENKKCFQVCNDKLNAPEYFRQGMSHSYRYPSLISYAHSSQDYFVYIDAKTEPTVPGRLLSKGDLLAEYLPRAVGLYPTVGGRVLVVLNNASADQHKVALDPFFVNRRTKPVNVSEHTHVRRVQESIKDWVFYTHNCSLALDPFFYNRRTEPVNISEYTHVRRSLVKSSIRCLGVSRSIEQSRFNCQTYLAAVVSCNAQCHPFFRAKTKGLRSSSAAYSKTKIPVLCQAPENFPLDIP